MYIGLDLVVSVSAMTSSIGSYCIVENLFSMIFRQTASRIRLQMAIKKGVCHMNYRFRKE